MRCVEAGHIYVLENVDNTMGQKITFMKKEDGRVVHDGTTNEEVLKMLIERIKCLDRKLPCRENYIALTKLEEALMWLDKRTQLRTEMGVEGRDIPHTMPTEMIGGNPGIQSFQNLPVNTNLICGS